MNFKSLVAQLANRINQPHVIETYMRKVFASGAEWQKEKSIEILSSVLENWVHGGDADCIIAEFEEKLNNENHI